MTAVGNGTTETVRSSTRFRHRRPESIARIRENTVWCPIHSTPIEPNAARYAT